MVHNVTQCLVGELVGLYGQLYYTSQKTFGLHPYFKRRGFFSWFDKGCRDFMRMCLLTKRIAKCDFRPRAFNFERRILVFYLPKFQCRGLTPTTFATNY